MSEQLLNEDATISGENRSSVENETPLNKGPSEKRKRKRKKNRKASKDHVKLQELAVETSIKSDLQEQSTELVNAADVSSKTCSKITQSNVSVTPLPGEEKSEKQKKGQDSLKSDGTDHDNLKVTSSVNGTPLEGDVFSQPLTNKCLKPDDNMSKHDVEPSLSEDMSMGKQKNEKHDVKESNDDDMGSNDNCHGPQIGGALPVPDVKAINSTCKLEPEVSEQISYSPNCVNTSPMNKLREHEDADNSLDEEHSVRTYMRKRRKVSYSQENSLETSEQGSSALVLNLLILPNESRKTCSDYPDEALASDCLVDASEREALAGHDTSMVVGKDSLLEHPLGVSSDLEHASLESTENSKDTANGDGSVKDVVMTDLAGANFEQAERARLNVDMVCGMHSVEEKIESREKASGDGSAQGPPIETLDQKILTKIEDSTASTSELGSVQANGSQPINQALGKASGCSRKKLLVLDVNGLLADIVPNERVQYQPDTIISTKAVFKRPFCDDFLQFCFERFNVGVWSSRTKKNVERVLDFLFRNKGYKLLFCWDQSHCTETGYNTVENKEKPLLLKELKKLWEKQDPDLPWERGEYDESNTLLLDDSPYKALRNPPNTAIFPYTFEYWHKTDNALAAKGHLRLYLERLAAAENVQKFVEQHPFGQRPITKTNLSWPFYLKVIGATSTPPEAGDNSSSATKSPLGEGTNSSAVC